MSAPIKNPTVVFGSLLISAITIASLLWIIYIKGATDELSSDTSVLPSVNALFNGLSTCFLVAGFVAIRRRRVSIHKRFMVAAVVSSLLFVITYVIYHNTHGDTQFQGEGAIRLAYFFILISHILVTTIALPLILITFFFAFTRQFYSHKRFARITLSAWLNVSVTGLTIFFLLKLSF